jgi:hemerythrin
MPCTHVSHPVFSVGIPEIDAQHDEITRRVNAFLASCRATRERAALQAMLNHLLDYVRGHFALEESLPATRGHPLTAAHRQMHAEFVAAFGALTERMGAEGATPALLMQASLLLVDWLLQHETQADLEIARLGAHR